MYKLKPITMKKILSIALILALITSCKKKDEPKPLTASTNSTSSSPTSWTVVFNFSGHGTYHYQADTKVDGHVGNPGEATTFTVTASKGELIEADCIADSNMVSINQVMTVQMIITPSLGYAAYYACGYGKQQVQYQN